MVTIGATMDSKSSSDCLASSWMVLKNGVTLALCSTSHRAASRWNMSRLGKPSPGANVSFLQPMLWVCCPRRASTLASGCRKISVKTSPARVPCLSPAYSGREGNTDPASAAPSRPTHTMTPKSGELLDNRRTASQASATRPAPPASAGTKKMPKCALQNEKTYDACSNAKIMRCTESLPLFSFKAMSMPNASPLAVAITDWSKLANMPSCLCNRAALTSNRCRRLMNARVPPTQAAQAASQSCECKKACSTRSASK
mmetsp:Transcript_6051/g.14466  ORF Transcript_6051/g.14466 Transcript_6051/m.14466 type:complete len:257 (+) Transcript_6051:1380-2150(+)